MITDLTWDRGYSRAELDAAQEAFSLRFPPDLIELLLEARLPDSLDWIKDEVAIRGMLAWPLDGLLFDVENGGLWWPEWGQRPKTPNDRAEVVGEIVAAAPKLIPVRGHRYIPEVPNERGNPIFSVHQSDIVYYGMNLENYLFHEFGVGEAVAGDLREIPFWSEAELRACDDDFYRES